MKRIGYHLVACTFALAFAVGVAAAQTPTPNGATTVLRVFNDCPAPNSTASVINSYPGSIAFTNQNLNELIESCVAVLQPQANRERIIIRTSLAHMLPPVIADARAAACPTDRAADPRPGCPDRTRADRWCTACRCC